MDTYRRRRTRALLVSIPAILVLCMTLSCRRAATGPAEPELRPVHYGVERTLSVDARKAKEVEGQEWIKICRECEQSQDMFLLVGGTVQYESGNLTADFWLREKKSHEDFARSAERIVEAILEKVSNRGIVISFYADEAGIIDLAFLIADNGSDDEKALRMHFVSPSFYGFLTKYVANRAPMGMRDYTNSINWHIRRLVGCTQAYYAPIMAENAVAAIGKQALDGEFSNLMLEEVHAISTYDRISPETKPAWECAQKMCKLAGYVNGMAMVPSMSMQVKRAYQEFEHAVRDYEKIVECQYWE